MITSVQFIVICHLKNERNIKNVIYNIYLKDLEQHFCYHLFGYCDELDYLKITKEK